MANRSIATLRSAARLVLLRSKGAVSHRGPYLSMKAEVSKRSPQILTVVALVGMSVLAGSTQHANAYDYGYSVMQHPRYAQAIYPQAWYPRYARADYPQARYPGYAPAIYPQARYYGWSGYGNGLFQMRRDACGHCW
jgi:hypothetical protein